MTQEIKPTYVTREQANRLKEKEFDLPTYAYYSGLNFYTGEYKNHSQTTIGDTPMHKMLIGYTSAPEQWQVIEWLRVNHGIWINIEPEEYGQYYYVKLNVCSQELWEDLDKRHEVITAHRKFNNEHKTPQKAYSAAFDYILNDLI